MILNDVSKNRYKAHLTSITIFWVQLGSITNCPTSFYSQEINEPSTHTVTNMQKGSIFFPFKLLNPYCMMLNVLFEGTINNAKSYLSIVLVNDIDKYIQHTVRIFLFSLWFLILILPNTLIGQTYKNFTIKDNTVQ